MPRDDVCYVQLKWDNIDWVSFITKWDYINLVEKLVEDESEGIVSVIKLYIPQQIIEMRRRKFENAKELVDRKVALGRYAPYV